MKSIYSALFQLMALCIFAFVFPLSISAQNNANSSDNVTISDAVSADLAVKGYLDNISVSYFDGNVSNDISINDTKHWIPASTIKLFAAMYAYMLINDKKLHLWNTVTADEKNVVPTEFVTDKLPTIQAGDTLTIDLLLRQMITQSDNTAFNILIDVLDRQKINQYIHSLGLTHTAIGSKLNLDNAQTQYEYEVSGYGINTTTANDYTKAFLLIKNNKIPGAKSLFELLKQQKINYMLPLFLPKSTIVAHKHGDLDPLYHDGGIIISPDNKLSYVLCIFSNLGDPNIVAHLSELIYTKNYDLVGTTSEQPPEESPNPSIDPLVAEEILPKQEVLGATTPILPSQPITAADLGITTKDLSLDQSTEKLPHIIIPADSPFHFLAPTLEFIRKTLAFSPRTKLQADLDSISLQLAEAKDEKDRRNLKLANEIFQSLQANLIHQAQTKAVANDPIAQNSLQSISDTRFSILGDELIHAKKSERLALIKEIANQAKSTLAEVQPFIPEAANATNLSQKPLVGEITQMNDSNIIIKTPGGNEVTVPIDNPSVRIRDKEIIPLPSVTPQATIQPSLSPIAKSSRVKLHIGATVAIIGSSNGELFLPSFILTNLPEELIAPQPAPVIKVNTKDRTMVIVENGLPVQVNITKQTIIKGTDTSISLQSIKPGDVVVVHGESTSVSTSNTSNLAAPSVPKTSPTTVDNTASPVFTKTFQQSTAQSPQKPQPHVIQSTSVQVIEKAQDAKQSHSAQNQPQQSHHDEHTNSNQPSHSSPQTTQSVSQPSKVKNDSDKRNKTSK